MNFQEQIRAFQQKRNEASERQAALMKSAGDEGRTLDAEEASEYDGLETEVAHVDKHLDRLRKLAGEEGKTAAPVESKAPMGFVRKQDKDDDFQGQSYTRLVIAKALAQLSGYERTASQIAEHRWGKTHPQLVQHLKTAVPGGASFTGAWGAELVTPDNRYMGDFIEFLHGMTVYDRLGLREVPAHVTIKGQDGAGTAYWVGESKAIPVSAQDYSTISLKPLKVAAIAAVSKELLIHSSPAAEALVRDALVQRAAHRADTTFLGTAAASVGGETPAGIRNGVSDLGSNGSSAAALRADIKELYAPFLAAKNATGLTLVMNPALAKAISLMVNALGQTEFPGLGAMGGTLLGDPVVVGDNVPANTIILLKPSDIWRIGDSGIEVSLSMDATIEMNDDPQGDSENPTASSANPVSMFQTESVAFKVVRPTNYAKRRSHAAQWIGDADYGNDSATTA